MGAKFILISALILTSFSGFSQEDEDHDHHHHKNEVSIATGVVPLPAEDAVTVGFHLHYIRGIFGEHKRIFGAGLGLETIIDEHKHFTISIPLQARLFAGFIISYAPGMLIARENGQSEIQFAQHIEATYEFELGKFHIGPVAEVGIEEFGVHYMGGVHFGIDF